MVEVNTFDRKGCKAIGRKFSGFPASHFLYANTVAPDSHTSGNIFAVQAVWRIFVRRERRTERFGQIEYVEFVVMAEYAEFFNYPNIT